MEQAVALAVRNNPRLSAAVRDVSAGRLGVRSARALTNPEFLLTPGALSVAGQNQELLLSQPLELNGTRSARSGVAGAQLHRTQSEATVELRNLVAQTKTAYYELARAREQRALAADVLTATQEVDRITRRQIELGSASGHRGYAVR